MKVIAEKKRNSNNQQLHDPDAKDLHLPVSVWLLTCALGISSCASVGRAAKPVCPVLPPAPASLMQKPTTEQRVRAELFAPPPSATPRSKGSKP